MKKKIICVLLCLTLLLCNMPFGAYALDSGVSKVSLGVIKHYQATTSKGDHSDKPLVVTVTVPKIYTGGTVLAALYTDGVFTKLIPVSIDSTTLQGKISIGLNHTDGDGLPLTPDSIKLFTWEQGRLKPLAKSHEALSESVITAANANVVKFVLDYILGYNNKKSITNYVRDNFNFETEHDKIDALLDNMDTCAAEAYEKKDTNLLTSEYARRTFYDDIIAAFNTLKDDEVQKNEFIRMYTNLNSGYESTVKDIFKRLSYLLCIDIDTFIKQN